MKAAVYYENGGPEVMRYEEVPDPKCDVDEILIRVEAISVEGGDLLHRQSFPPATRPHIVGYSAAGEILELGADVEGFRVGQKVVTFGQWGSHAARRAVKKVHCWPLPPGLDVRTAAGIPAAFGTAHECLFEAGQLRAGQNVLIQGAAGGVGVAAVQLAKRAGAFVIGTAGSDARLEKLREFGLDAGINYRTTPDFAAEVRRLTGGTGVHVTLDMAGGNAMKATATSMATFGRLIIVGVAAREPTLIDAVDILVQRLSVIGLIFGDVLGIPRTDAMLRELLAATARGELSMPIDRAFALKDVAAGHAYAESKERGFGRVLLIP